ncbi:cbb3-type cytochrome oxidase assembly protein CcoS [Flavitalea sp. BT771]|uniref:cbb3-type cytochrome oxidase assembly protein CcoS n=1 Tax=Flavitalea sp. BT771 TaxID=3063329 RepID=UPI0026E3E4F9|nr:cbb3-type cytochrome oxidase assembly protein CcoS [Flavitalea sp. BT771]MDO6429474.1 cbb3-type cytochrome oxidase assembly protein CcoS [Flavitalea sp. BT771]MDV6218398.1 cbb3-type cytochrome oxidase assembly protein CcoS [Flavitalea sp. BT771]
MSAILLLLIVSLSVASLFLGAFIWGVKHHQFDDGYAPPRRILFDDQPVENIPGNSANEHKIQSRSINQNRSHAN